MMSKRMQGMGGCNEGIDISVSERVKCGDENIALFCPSEHTLTVGLYPAVGRPEGVFGNALEVALVPLPPPPHREEHHRLVVALPLLRCVVLGAVEHHLVFLVLQKYPRIHEQDHFHLQTSLGIDRSVTDLVLDPVVDGGRVGLHPAREGDVGLGPNSIELTGHRYLRRN